MIITLIIIGVILLAIIGTAYIDKVFAILPFFVGVMVLGCLGLCIADAQIDKDIEYQSKLHEREVIEYRLEHMEDSIVGNEMLYDNIVEFNNSLRETKKWANNPWTNWFYNQDIATIDYIEIDGH